MTEEQKPHKLLLKILDFDRHDLVTAKICEWLTLGDCALLCQTCKRLYERRSSILSDFIDINTRLRYYFDDPLTFRAKLGQWQALLSGPFTLQAAECSYGASPVLDIYADEFSGNFIIAYLKSAENYKSSIVRVNVRV